MCDYELEPKLVEWIKFGFKLKRMILNFNEYTHNYGLLAITNGTENNIMWMGIGTPIFHKWTYDVDPLSPRRCIWGLVRY